MPHPPTAMPPVHPRSRGEHRPAMMALVFSRGSSPLPRGTRVSSARKGHRGRFIPAPAGNTNVQPLRRIRETVHPRSRGEHNSSPFSMHVTVGSSPLPRGTPDTQQRWHVDGRFIPAPAGNTRPKRIRAEILPVHPRSRGEHAMRRWTWRWRPRFIPAPAGNTRQNHRRGEIASVHPRSRGEHRRIR